MINIGIDPILVKLGSFSISWHSLFMMVAIVVGVWLSARLVAKAGLSVDRLYSIAIWGVPGGIIGARLVHVIDHWDLYRDLYATNPGGYLSFEGGLALWGGILGGTLAVLIFSRVSRFSIAPYADRIGLVFILGQAIGRIGDIINGEHLSTPTSLPWGVVYTNPAAGRAFQHSLEFGAVHPAVAYELLMDLFIFGILWRLRGRFKPEGSLFLLYLSLYATGRFFLSSLRLDSNTVFLSLNQAQWISLLVLAVAIPLLIWRKTSYQKQAN